MMVPACLPAPRHARCARSRSRRRVPCHTRHRCMTPRPPASRPALSPSPLTPAPLPTAGVNLHLPSSAKLKVSPSCSSTNGNAAGSTTCTVQMSAMPNGWVLPKSKLEGATMAGVRPCAAPYTRFRQTTVSTKAPFTVQSSCY